MMAPKYNEGSVNKMRRSTGTTGLSVVYVLLIFLCATGVGLGSNVTTIEDEMPFAVNAEWFAGDIIQLVVTWDVDNSQNKVIDVTVYTPEVTPYCPEVGCQKLHIDAVSKLSKYPENISYRALFRIIIE